MEQLATTIPVIEKKKLENAQIGLPLDWPGKVNKFKEVIIARHGVGISKQTLLTSTVSVEHIMEQSLSNSVEQKCQCLIVWHTISNMAA